MNYSKTVYEPCEDSYLLAKQVKKYSKGNVLDMGTGSGIQGINALTNKNTKSVTFCDINSKAIEYVKEIVKKDANINKLKIPIFFKISDLYSKISSKEKFDTIIFNPPYLPDDELDDEKLITTGGKQGWEIVERFLFDSKVYLNIDGQILLLFSSLTDKSQIDKIISNLTYEKNFIAKENLFMEQLYVYQLKLTNPNIIKGHRGIVEIIDNVVIKRSLTEYYNSSEEAKFLKILNKYGIGPKYISHKKDELQMEYIKGNRILDYLEKSTKKQIIDILDKILNQLFIMDELKINKLELTNPYKHIIVRNHIPIQIDFERCIYTTKPKNVTQFIQFLSSGKLNVLFKQKNISIDLDKLRIIAIIYKKEINKKYLKEILKCLS
jgi:release factor glutamine methyltransferase